MSTSSAEEQAEENKQPAITSNSPILRRAFMGPLPQQIPRCSASLILPRTYRPSVKSKFTETLPNPCRFLTKGEDSRAIHENKQSESVQLTALDHASKSIRDWSPTPSRCLLLATFPCTGRMGYAKAR